MKSCALSKLKNWFGKNKHFILSAIIPIVICSALHHFAATEKSFLYLLQLNNSLAAILGLIGTWLIYIYGIPNRTKHDHHSYLIMENSTEQQKEEEKKTNSFISKANSGFGMIAASFLITGFLTTLP